VQGELGPVGERVGHRDARIRHASRSRTSSPSNAGGASEREERGAAIVHEFGKGVRMRRDSTTRMVGLLEDGDGEAGARKVRRAHQSLVAGPHDHHTNA
jgi:hypothetical protein